MVGKHRTPQQRKLQSIFRDVRKQGGLTQFELAEMLGKPESYVSKYESGERQLDLPEIEAICLVVGIELAEFVRRYQQQ